MAPVVKQVGSLGDCLVSEFLGANLGEFRGLTEPNNIGHLAQFPTRAFVDWDGHNGLTCYLPSVRKWINRSRSS